MPLEYDIAHHVRCDLTLRSGRKVGLRSLDQVLTYGGWLEGTPTRRTNDLELEAALAPPDSWRFRTYLVPPERRDYLRSPGDMHGEHPFGPPEWLPMVRCSATFRSSSLRSRPEGASWLRVVWFQDEFALPIATPVVEHLRALDWEQLASADDGPSP